MALPHPSSRFDIQVKKEQLEQEAETCDQHDRKRKDESKRTNVISNVQSLVRIGTGHRDERESGKQVQIERKTWALAEGVDENKDVASCLGHPAAVVTRKQGPLAPLLLEAGSGEEMRAEKEVQNQALNDDSDCADPSIKSTLPRFVYGICNTSSFKRRKKEAAKSYFVGGGCSSPTSGCTKVELQHEKHSFSSVLCNVNGHQSALHLAGPKGTGEHRSHRDQDGYDSIVPPHFQRSSVVAYSGGTFSDAIGNGSPDSRVPSELSFQEEALDLTIAQGKRDGQADFGDQESEHSCISYTAEISEEAKSSTAGDGGQDPDGSSKRFLSITGMIQKQKPSMRKCYEVEDTVQETEGKESWTERRYVCGSDRQDSVDSHPMIGYYRTVHGEAQLVMPSEDAASDIIGDSRRMVGDDSAGVFEDCSGDGPLGGMLDHEKNIMKHSLMGYYRVMEDSDHSEGDGDMFCQEKKGILRSQSAEANAGDDPIKRFKCKVCGRAFRHSQGLSAHKKIHSDERPFPCQYCDLKFRVKQNLITHVRTHTGEKPYSCEICGRGFGQQSTMVRHLRSHTGEKPFTCKYCQRKFTQRHVMMNHVRIHTGEKPYSCEVCGKDFKEQHNLVRHVRTHTGEKPYTCGDCGNKFTQKNHLMRHAKVHIPKKHTI